MKPGRLISPPGTYFVTFSTWQRCRLFVVENYVRLFLKTVYRHRRDGRYQIHAFVVMPEHVHLLISEPQIADPSTVVQAVKLGFTQRWRALRGASGQFWQRRFYDFNVWSQRKEIEKLNYMHRNPVVRGLVDRPEEWGWSSYCHYLTGERGTVQIESHWTAGRREGIGGR